MKIPLKIPGVVGVEIDEAMLRSHVMRPKHLEMVGSDRGPQSPGAPAARPPGPRPRILTHLDVTNFQYGIQEALTGSCVGYCMQLRQHGNVVAQQNYDFAQLAVGVGPNLSWTFDQPMHVASLSKMITAIAMTKALLSAGIPASTSIASYLPAYWSQGLNVSQITFANLLTHTSGLTSDDPSFESMKNSIASGVTAVGGYAYANVNFSLCRILLSVLNGNVAANFETCLADFLGGIFAAFVDVTWDLVTITAFQQYVAANVFSPSASGAHVVHQPTDALAYDFPTTSGEIGWNDGDLATWSGAAAWHMSVNQLLGIMGTFRRGGTIVSSQQAQTMLDNGFGIDWTVGTSAGGSYYAKNGLFWTASSTNSWQTEQGVAFYLPEDMELVVLVNSPVGVVPNATPPPLTVGEFLYSVVSEVYEANLA